MDLRAADDAEAEEVDDRLLEIVTGAKYAGNE